MKQRRCHNSWGVSFPSSRGVNSDDYWGVIFAITGGSICAGTGTRLLKVNDDGEWSHHMRQPAVFVTKSIVHVIDCLDRTPSSVLQFATDLTPGEKIVKIHTGQTQRVVAFEFMQNRLQKQVTKEEQVADEEVTWDSLFGERKRHLQSSENHVRSPLIEVIYHDIPAFHFSQVC